MQVRKQKTINKSFEISGIGVHSGKMASVSILPADEGHGIVFQKSGISIPALACNVKDTKRCTSIGTDDISISTIEHLLAACFGLGIDNILIRIEGDEIPILDGSSLELVKLFKEAGISEQKSEKPSLSINTKISARSEDQFIVGIPSESLSITVVTDYPHPLLGLQMIQFLPDKDNFEEKLAPARTFCMKEEIEKLLEGNLGRGGNIDNVLIIDRDTFYNTPRFEDEPARHKCLDLLGDLMLAGVDIKGHIFAYKPGHKINTDFANIILNINNLQTNQ